MAQPRVTVAVVPGERFSLAPQSLASILQHRDASTELVYVDGGSPPLVRQYLEQRAVRDGFRLVSTERYVSPNAARNLALAEVRTKYVAFVDNDVTVTGDWLAPLVECAEATRAWAVGAVCCRREADGDVVHSAGGDVEIVERGDRRALVLGEHCAGRPLSEVASSLCRGEVGQVAFRAALVRMSAFEQVGPLDEGLWSAAQHTDFCLLARAHGGSIYLEPTATVTSECPASFEPEDLDYFQLRWSDAWNRATLDHLREKWNLPADDPGLRQLSDELAEHRRLTLEPYRRVLRLFGRPAARWFERILIAPLEEAANRRRYPLPAASQPLRRAA